MRGATIVPSMVNAGVTGIVYGGAHGGGEGNTMDERAKAALLTDGVTIDSTTPAPGWATGAADEPQSSSPAPAVGGPDVADLRARLERHR
jgi:hypothetical protein